MLEANTGLASLGVVLPAGTPVYLPPFDTVTSARPLLQLFD
ncbi:tail protein X [Bacillus licheniformis]|nr:tail protein X [Bacillus licheniformis]